MVIHAEQDKSLNLRCYVHKIKSCCNHNMYMQVEHDTLCNMPGSVTVTYAWHSNFRKLFSNLISSQPLHGNSYATTSQRRCSVAYKTTLVNAEGMSCLTSGPAGAIMP